MLRSTSYRQLILPYTGWWLFWTALQTIVVHRLYPDWQLSLTDAVVTNLLLALAGHIIVNTYRFYTPGRQNYFFRAGYILVLTIICVAAMNRALYHLFPGNASYMEFSDKSLPIRFLFSLLMISFMAVVSWLRFYMNEQQENKNRKDDAERLLRDAELSRLRQQLQPHFLFNSLNSISALAGSRPEEARKMVQQLSDFLRGTLKKDDQQFSAFKEELQHLELYLEIEKVRFGHRLHTKIEYDKNCLVMEIPSLLLQPVVENAIKFGLYDTTDEITIEIQAAGKDSELIIKVQNPFDPSTTVPQQGTGFGLNSVQRRLYLLYGRTDLLTVEQNENLFITSFKIPQRQ